VKWRVPLFIVKTNSPNSALWGNLFSGLATIDIRYLSTLSFSFPCPTGFAVSLNYMAKYPNSTMPYKAGYEEDAFLKSIDLKINEIEPKAHDCTEVYVWHTQTTKSKSSLIKIADDLLVASKTNLHKLMKFLDEMGVSHTSPDKGELLTYC
jgi:hypothetical protein